MTKPVDKDSLPLDKPRRTPGHPTKSHVVKTKVDGKEKIIRFGEQGAETAGKPKAGESDRMKQKRASFKARHAKNIAKGKSSPAYWANKIKWNEGGAVGRGMENVSELWRQYLPSNLSDQDFSDLNQRLQYRPLNVKRLIESGAIRITDPAGDPSGEGWSLVTGWNDKYPESSTPKWADRPGAYASAMQALNQPGPLYDGKYRQVLWSAMRAGLRPEDVFLEQPEGYARGGAVKMAAGGSAALALIEQMRRSGAQSQEFDPVLVSMREQQRARPARRPPSSAAFSQTVPTPQTREEPLPLPPTPPAMRPDENPPPEAPPNPMRFDEGNPHVATAISMAQRYNLPRDIFLSLVQQESRFDPNARSPRGAIGLGQLMPATARELGVDPRDPVQNLEGAARYLRQQIDRFGDMSLALAAYNAGPGAVRRAGNTIPNNRETQRYVPSILRRAGVQQGEFAEGGLADLDQKYAEGGRVRRTLRDEMRNIEAEIRGERPASIGVTVARGIGEGGGGIAGVTRRVGRVARGPDEPPMIAMHNTRPERLERMAEREGVAVAPSIAITRADNPIDSFGDVSLMVSPQTVDPRRTPVYARDAYTPRYPVEETSRNKPYVRLYNENTGESRLLPHTPQNALRVMRNQPWRGGEDFVTDNWLLAHLTPQFRNMSELRAARSRLVPATDTAVADWTKGLDDLRSEWSRVLSESGQPADWRFADSLQRNLAEAANRRDGMAYINREYYNNAIPEDLLARTQAHLDAGRALPTTYFEAKPTRLVPLSEFEGAVVPSQAPQDLTDLLRRYGIEDIQYYASPEQRAEQVRRFERLLFGGAPVAAGAALAAEGAEPEPEGYAEGGEVRTPEEEEYDRRLLSRMKAQTGRVTEPTRAEQMQALRTAGREAAEGVADVLLPQSPLDLALMAAFGPGGRAARLAGSAALASLEPSEAEASRFRRLIRAYHGSPHKFDEFDIRKIGTGEGAQAYGRGLYFAEDEDVAKHYRDKLAPFRPSDVKDVRAAISDREAALVRALDDQAQINLQVQSGRLLPNALRNAENDVARARYDLDIQQRRFADMNDSFGHMYEVDLNAGPRDFLNWDAPLSQQSRGVQESLQRFGLRADPDAARAYDDALLDALYGDPNRALPPQPRDPTGEDIYKRLLRMDPEEARVALMEVGIPGTRYLDAGSRGIGGTYNYAVFDPEIIDIRRRYAEGGLAQLDQKYAEGGIVSAEAAKYDPDAVDALVKQIEAEYV